MSPERRFPTTKLSDGSLVIEFPLSDLFKVEVDFEGGSVRTEVEVVGGVDVGSDGKIQIGEGALEWTVADPTSEK